MKFKIIFLLLSTFQLHPFLIIGHRGACGYKPENTLSSFQLAVQMGVDMIELDVYACKTGELVVHHDDSVDRTTNGHGNVIDMSFEQLRNLKIDDYEQIPTLSEVIDLVHGQIPINIELKGPGTAEPVVKLLQKYLSSFAILNSSSVIPDADPGSRSLKYFPSNFVVSSFDHAQVQQFKNLLPSIKVGVLFSWNRMPENIVEIAQQSTASFIGLDVKVVNQELVDQVHAAGFLVYVWTVNDKATADAMRAFGVDGIFANYPDRV
jgi:glycerophosphoryl diester phosphodiesterase